MQHARRSEIHLIHFHHWLLTVLTMADQPNQPAAAANAASPKKKRVYLTLHNKVGLVIEAEKVVNAEKKMSFKAFCREKDVDPAQLRRWTKNIVKYKQAMENTTKKRAKLVATVGRRSTLSNIRVELLKYVDAHENTGRTISIRRLAIHARKLDKSLRRMKRYALFARLRRFCVSNGVVIRRKTHQSQEDPRKKVEIATAFLLSTRPRLHQCNRHPAFIMNMDQTPYNPTDTGNTTLARRGSKTVVGKDIKTSVGRITACLTVCADGTKLEPFLIYKAKPNGTVYRELKDFPKGAKYTVQENAWCDERCMLLWVDNVLAPYVKTAPKGIVPYLLLDKHTCHYQGSVARAIEDLGVEWDILPGGCTGLIQPVDVGINKPWKNRLRCRMEDCLAETENCDRLRRR